MKDISMAEMLQMQMDLWKKNSKTWEEMSPKQARNMMLWMVEEIGEAIAIIKKKGEEEIMVDPKVREKFLEEMVDVMMYFNATLLRLNISSEEFANKYEEKQNFNMNRNFQQDYDNLIK
jgi:hypothetical protein